MENDCLEGTLKCTMCSYVWMPRRGSQPQRCPNCRTTKWAQEGLRSECCRCGYIWNSRNGDPVRCPSCGTHKWKTAPVYNTCPLCGYKWEPKGAYIPRKCPSCLGRLWGDDENVIDRKAEARIKLDDEVARLHRQGLDCVEIAIKMKIAYSKVRESVDRQFPGASMKE